MASLESAVNEHAQGATLTAGGLVASLISWFLAHIQIIDGVMQFVVLLVSLIAGIIGMRKLLKKNDARRAAE